MVVHTKGKNKRKSYDHPPIKDRGFKNSKRDFSNNECFTCHKMGHIAINCTMKAKQVKKKKEIFQFRFVEDNDKEEEERTKENEYSCEEYALISGLTSLVSLGNDTWLVDSGASKNMTGYKDSLSFLVQKESANKVMFGDDH